MKTLEEIKNDVCLEYGYYTYSIVVSDFKQGRMDSKTFNCIVRDIAKEVAKEALKNASENARLHDGLSLLKEIQYIDEMGYDVGVTIDKQSILNESNILKL